jgi:hypothetical protein
VFKEYLDTHHTIAPERPLRIVPVTDNLLALAKIDDKMTVQIRGATPLSHITFVSGDTRGISCLENGIPVPVANGRVIGKAQCDDSGSCDWHLPSTNTGAYITAVTTPMKSSDGKKLISYPVKVN